MRLSNWITIHQPSEELNITQKVQQTNELQLHAAWIEL
jgi:hypothetical protein